MVDTGADGEDQLAPQEGGGHEDKVAGICQEDGQAAAAARHPEDE